MEVCQLSHVVREKIVYPLIIISLICIIMWHVVIQRTILESYVVVVVSRLRQELECKQFESQYQSLLKNSGLVVGDDGDC